MVRLPPGGARALRVALTVVLLVTLFFMGREALSREAVRLLPPLPQTVLFLAAALPLLGLRILKWTLIVRAVEPAAAYFPCLRGYFAALPWSLVTPGKLGELGRCLFMPYEKLKGGRGAGLVLADNLTDGMATLLLLLLGLYGVAGWAGGAAGLGAFLLCLFIFRALGRSEKAWARLPQRWAIRRNALELQQSLGDLHGSRLAWALFLGFLANGLEFVLGGALFLCLGGAEGGAGSAIGGAGSAVGGAGSAASAAGSLGSGAGGAEGAAALLKASFLMAWVALGSAFQVTVAGLGQREGLAALLSEAKGLEGGAAALAVFYVFAFTLALPACIGLFLQRRMQAPEAETSSASASL